MKGESWWENTVWLPRPAVPRPHSWALSPRGTKLRARAHLLMQEGRGCIQGPQTCLQAPPRAPNSFQVWSTQARAPPPPSGLQGSPGCWWGPTATLLSPTASEASKPCSPPDALTVSAPPRQPTQYLNTQPQALTATSRPWHSAPRPATRSDTALLCSPWPKQESSPSPLGTLRRGNPPSPLPSQEIFSIPPHLCLAPAPLPVPAPPGGPHRPRRHYRPPRPTGASPLPWGQAEAAGHPGSCSRSRRGGLARPRRPPRPAPCRDVCVYISTLLFLYP